MRSSLMACLALLAACGGDDTTAAPDAPDPPMCGPCDANARCVLENGAAACECNPGYEGNGTTCADVDECTTNNGGCDPAAACINTDGGNSCTCVPGWEGDGFTCTAIYDESRAACSEREAEHPGYTTIARDVALCGGRYTPTTIGDACNTGWHVCKKTEWLAHYPTNRPYGETPDPIGATIGQLSSWGQPQLLRCGGNVWMGNVPDNTDRVPGPVCYYPGDEWDNAVGADYHPWNAGKFLFDDDGTTILVGVNAEGVQGDCCSWDVSWAPTTRTTGFAVYCCQDVN
jgi:hypothetical protein